MLLGRLRGVDLKMLLNWSVTSNKGFSSDEHHQCDRRTRRIETTAYITLASMCHEAKMLESLRQTDKQTDRHLFNDLFSRTTWHRKGKTIPDLNEARDDGIAMASTEPYANHLQPCQHLITQYFYRLDALRDVQPTVSKL